MKKPNKYKGLWVFILIFICLMMVYLPIAGTATATEEMPDLEELLNQLQETSDQQIPERSSSLALSFLKMLIGLVVIIVLIYLTVALLNRLNNVRNERSPIKVIDYSNIGPSKGICIAKVGSKTMILGVTDHNISLLGDLSPQEAQNIIDSIEEFSLDEKMPRPFSLSALFKTNFLERKKINDFSFHEHLENNLKKIQSINSSMKNNNKGEAGND
ncbi:MAG: flagellar biosynthetic protein FliO [Bacillota bacterium]|nr:flagellar biosynthetic protein FliO [Bacillota bacterium]